MRLRMMIVLEDFSSDDHRRPNCKLRKVVKVCPGLFAEEDIHPGEEITDSVFFWWK